MRGFSFLVTSFLIVGVSSPPAHADTIGIMDGTLTLSRTSGVMHLEGPRGFVLDSTFEGSSLLGAIVAPGDTVVLTMEHMGLRGTVSIDGQTFQIHPFTGPVLGEGNLFASVVAPPFSGDQAASVVAPFTFTGRIVAFGMDLAPFPLELVGLGTVQVDFLLNPLVTPPLPLWEPQRAVFQFDPIPEPATLILVGSGLAGCLMRRRRTRCFPASGPSGP